VLKVHAQHRSTICKISTSTLNIYKNTHLPSVFCPTRGP
jgi:hypothetical protein